MLESVIVTKKNGDFYCTQLDTEKYPTSLLGKICTSTDGYFWCQDVINGHIRKIMFIGSEISEIVFNPSLDVRFSKQD